VQYYEPQRGPAVAARQRLSPVDPVDAGDGVDESQQRVRCAVPAFYRNNAVKHFDTQHVDWELRLIGCQVTGENIIENIIYSRSQSEDTVLGFASLEVGEGLALLHITDK